MIDSNLKHHLDETGDHVVTLVGTSMYPMLRNRRDSVHLVKYNGEGIKKYDLPVYVRTDGAHVMHRCMGKDENGYIMCGDNQYVLEHGITDEQIIAMVKGFYRDEKYISVDNFFYKLYCRIWCLSLRARRQLLRVIHKINPNKKIMEQYKKL